MRLDRGLISGITVGGAWRASSTAGARLFLTMALFCACLIGGCGKGEKIDLAVLEEPSFEPFYEVLEEMEQNAETTQVEGKKITLTASGMSLTEFLRYIADQAGVSIVCDQSLDGLPLTLTVTNTDVKDVLSAVARRYNVDITEQGNVYYIGTLKPQDRAILVRKVKRLTAQEITQMVQTLNSEVGKVAASSDGLTVVGDRVRVLQNINSMFDQVEMAQTNTWVLQMYLISGTTGASRELGVDTTATFNIAATLANSRSKIDSLGVFKAVLKSSG